LSDASGRPTVGSAPDELLRDYTRADEQRLFHKPGKDTEEWAPRTVDLAKDGEASPARIRAATEDNTAGRLPLERSGLPVQRMDPGVGYACVAAKAAGHQEQTGQRGRACKSDQKGSMDAFGLFSFPKLSRLYRRTSGGYNQNRRIFLATLASFSGLWHAGRPRRKSGRGRRQRLQSERRGRGRSSIHA
jgi:hypothetical protein